MFSDDDDEWVAVQLDDTGMYPKAQKVAIYPPLISMSSDNDDEWVAVQLDGTGMYPRAQKVAIYTLSSRCWC
jgi:hypothetical protein